MKFAPEFVNAPPTPAKLLLFLDQPVISAIVSEEVVCEVLTHHWSAIAKLGDAHWPAELAP